MCMIVKDEEKTVANALRSAAPVVDDLVVVDTGSTDGTPDLVRRYTPRLYHFQWADDFAAARNFAMEHVRTDWILWLDADEQLTVTDGRRWLHAFAAKARRADALLVTLHNYYGSVADELSMYVYGSFRLLRTAAKLRYKQAVHEHLDLEGRIVRLDDEPVPGLVIRHFGYMDDPDRSRQKSDRNMRILLREQARPGYDPWIDYHMAVELYRRGEYGPAFEHVQRALKRFLEAGRVRPALAYKLKYELLLVTGATHNALPGIEHAIRLYPDYVDLHYYKGLFQYALRRFDDAAGTFARCLRLGERGRYLTLRGAGSFLAAYMLGLCQEALGRRRQAMEIYEQLVRDYPGFQPSLQRLHALRGQEEGA